MGKKIVMSEDEDGYEKWKNGKERAKEGKRKRGTGERISTDTRTGGRIEAVKKPKLGVDRSSRSVVGAKPTVAGRSNRNAIVGRRPGTSKCYLSLSALFIIPGDELNTDRM